LSSADTSLGQAPEDPAVALVGLLDDRLELARALAVAARSDHQDLAVRRHLERRVRIDLERLEQRLVDDERQARAMVAEKTQPQAAVTMNNLYDEISAGHIKELNVVLKVDVQGSVEPIRASLEKLGIENLKIHLIHAAAGNITESDVMLAAASKGLIIGFNTGVEGGALRSAEATGVEIRRYDIIYKLVEDLEKALKGLLEPTYVDVVQGKAEIKAVFSAGKHTQVAGVIVSEGKINRGSQARVRRGGEVIFESEINSLRRFKDDVKEVAAGYECGIGLKEFNGFEVGDTIEAYRKEKAA